MSTPSYESGYDPKYGYNRNAFQEKTFATAILGKTVKLIAAPLGLASEAIHSRRDRKASTSVSGAGSRGEDTKTTPPLDPCARSQEPVVEVPAKAADKLVESGRAVPADGAEATHEVVPVDEGVDRDEGDWALDDTAEENEPSDELPCDTQGNAAAAKNVEDPVDSAPKASVPQPDRRKGTASSSKLPFPVIIPQRRPGTKSRGFVRAYAPVLESHNITQEAFLGFLKDFLKDFHKAAQASPIFDIVIIATAIAGAYPDPVIGLAIQSIQVAVAMKQEVQERYRMNRFLDQANREIFMPNDLYAMVVAYKPGGSEKTVVETERVDLGAMAVTKYGDGLLEREIAEGSVTEKKRMEEMKEKANRFRIASGESRGEAGMPIVCAPLIFPSLDAAFATGKGNEDGATIGDMTTNMKANSKSAQKFVQEYIDKRSHAVFVSSFARRLTLLYRRYMSSHMNAVAQSNVPCRRP
ncbi:MAG: hypothetical protein Q9222_005446 [Ikaeria aurantiellina]